MFVFGVFSDIFFLHSFLTVVASDFMKIVALQFIMFLFLLENVLLLTQIACFFYSVYERSVRVDCGSKGLDSAEWAFVFYFSLCLF